MKRRKVEPKFAVCINNKDYEEFLELRKIYKVLPDAKTAERHYIRDIDESGEDYRYIEDYLIPIELSKAPKKAYFRYLDHAGNITQQGSGRRNESLPLTKSHFKRHETSLTGRSRKGILSPFVIRRCPVSVLPIPQHPMGNQHAFMPEDNHVTTAYAHPSEGH